MIVRSALAALFAVAFAAGLAMAHGQFSNQSMRVSMMSDLGGGGGPIGPLYNFPNQNIHDTYDPTCDGTDPSIMLCDGFEDGVWIDMNLNACTEPANCSCWTSFYDKPTSDYWAPQASGIQPYSCAEARTSGVIWNFAHCNSGPINGNLADFGVSGTPCTGSMNYADGRDVFSVHSMHTAKALTCTGGNCAIPDPTGGTNWVGIRFYFKESGVTSKMCDCNATGGFDCNRTTLPTQPCPDFQTRGANGYKQIELGENEAGFIQGNLSGTNSATNGRFGYGTGDCSPWGRTGVGCRTDGTFGGPEFDHSLHRDEWIFVEYEQRHADGPGTNNGHVRIWMDACGQDGKGCTGTPTLRAECTGLDNWNDGGGECRNNFNFFWNNWWSGDGSIGNYSGEIQIDELIVRDRTVTDADIGYLPPFE